MFPAEGGGETCFGGAEEEGLGFVGGDEKGSFCSGNDSSKTEYCTEEDLNVGKDYTIVNDKKLVITFKCPTGVPNEDYKYYVTTKVLPYLEQMITSTAITEYKFE